MKRIITKINFAGERAKQRGRAKAIRSLLSGKLPKRVISMLLCVCMTATMLCNLGGFMVAKAAAAEATGNVMDRIADGDTSDTYVGKLLSSDWGSRYAGRVWTDKSVFAFGDNINLNDDTDGYDGKIHFDSDFGTVFSALSSSQRINEYPPSPIDLVILIDMSGSMAADIVNSTHTHNDYDDPNGERITHSRIYAVLESINSTIDEVMDMGKADRVAVVAYGAKAYTLLELGHYKTKTETDGKYLEVKNFRNYYNNYSEERAPKNSGSASYMVGTVDGLQKLDDNDTTYSDYKRYVRNDYKETKYSCDPEGTVNIGFHTDLQAGIYQGFEELYNNYKNVDDVREIYESADTGAKTVVQRIPVAIVMTDGGSNYALQPTTGATGDEWHDVPTYEGNMPVYTADWEKYRAETNGAGRGGDAVILDILMTASYEKAKVEKQYAKLVQEAQADKDNPLLTDRFKGTDFRILTVSVDTPTQEWQVPRVYAALDPVHFFSADPQPNSGINPNSWSQKQDVTSAYAYFEQWQTAVESITVSFKDTDSEQRDIKFNRLSDSTDPLAVTNEDVVKNINYNKRFADITSGQLTATFDEMLNEVRGIAFTPLSGDNASGVADSITYQDPLGEYMELKNGAITVEGDVTGSTEKTFDMSLLLFGEMHGVVRAGVYDYQWNYDYMHNNGTKEGYPEKDANPDETPLRIGWYKGDALNAVYSYGDNGLPDGCDTAEKAWEQGWVLRFNYKILAEFVPISGITDTMKPTEVPEQIKNTVYTCYRFADSQADRNMLRRNPIFGAVPDELQKEWNDYFKVHGSYPVGMDRYSGYAGVYRLSDIRVWTEHTGDFVDQTGAITPEEESGYDDSLYVNLPIAAVPTQLAEITLGGEGPISYKDNLNDKKQSTPLRLFYAVGLAEDLIARDANGKQTGVDVSKISGEYIATHSDPENNSIYFISNWYSNTAYRGYTSDEAAEYHTRGDAAVTLSPNAKNRYYLFQKPLPLIAHAYRVISDTGDVAPVDRAADEAWKANGAGNGSTTWETVDGVAQSAVSWVGGEFIGTYESESAFKAALQAVTPDTEGKRYITDAKKYTYLLPDDITDAVITYTKDQLSKIDSDGDGYTKDSNSFSSDDYFFLCIEYYLPMDGKGKDIYGQEDPDTQAVRKVSRMIARKGSAFGSGLHSENIDNGDMLCWTDINGNCNLEIEYNSRTDTGDDTRGRPTLEKLTLTGDDLLNYLKDTCHLNTEPNADGQSYLDLDCAYWESVQADPHMKALIEQITSLPPAKQQAEFDELFDWSAAARTGGIRVGDMFNNMQAKGGGGTLTDGYYAGNVTKTANNYYIPTLSETSTAGDGLVINNYLGNNGRLEIANATLMVTKTLVAPDGFTLTEEQQNETFHYQVYVQGLTGERLAQRLKWNPFSQSWQKRVETLDILTDNASLLLDTSGSRALFCCTDGKTARQIVEVVEDGVTRYYYADATGAATKEPCDDSFDHFYYLYLPDSAGELNYHLFASTYEAGTTDLAGVGTTAYYPAGMDKSQLPAGDNSNQQFAEAVTGKDDPLANRPAGSREYWTKEAELIPYEEVKKAESSGTEVEGSSRWDHEENHGILEKHQQLEKFVLVTVIPDPEGTDSTIYSPYSSRTQYMTVPLYFGYKSTLAEHLKSCAGGGAFASCEHLEDYKLQGTELYDQIIPTVDRSDLFNATIGNATADDVAKNTAAYTLRSGEGLMLTGLGNRITYRFTEKLTDTQIEQGYLLKRISHIQQRGSDTVYMPGVQEIPYNDAYEPFAHTNATIWESYATMAAGALGNHHQPEASEGGIPAKNPSCNDAKTEANLDVGRCDIVQKDGTTRHYFYYGGKLVDPHYMGEQDGMSRYVLNPTAHFGVNGETQEGTKTVPATNPASGKYDYNGVYSVFGNTGYFTEQANYTNTIDPELFVLEKGLVDPEGNKVTVPPDREFTFTLTFEPTDSAAMTDTDGTLHYWKGNKDSWESSLEWEDADGNKYKMPTKAPKLDEYEPYLTDPTYRLKPIEPDKDTTHTYTITLKANEAVVFYGLIAGTKFTVTETKNENYPVEPSAGSINDGYTQTGTIYRASEDPKAIDPVTTPNRTSFTNRLLTGLLTVEKKVLNAETDPDPTKEFDFTVTLTPDPDSDPKAEIKKENLGAIKYGADNTPVRDFSLDWKPVDSGGYQATFRLAHGEKISIDGIPLNVIYTVRETQRDGYNLQHVADNELDTPAYLPLSEDSAGGQITPKHMQGYLLFVNDRAVSPPFVGGLGWMLFYLLGALLLILPPVIYYLYCRRRRSYVKSTCFCPNKPTEKSCFKEETRTMKTSKSILLRLLSLALVLLLALTAAVPAFAVNDPANKENLKITIHNNEGLPEMTATQFSVYQLFKGTPKQEGDAGANEWDATHWNDYVLADIQWGASINTPALQNALISALTSLDMSKNTWAGTDNPFKDVDSAAAVAEVLSKHTDNKFMQGFADFLMTGNAGGSFLTDLKIEGKVDGSGKDATLTYDLSSVGTGYYIFQDTNKPGEVSAVSEYIVAVMGSQDIDMKASVPTVDKSVTSVGTKGATADIGEPVKFILQGTLAQNFLDYATYTYTFHDTLSAGLTFDQATANLTVTLTDSNGKKYTLKDSEYTLTTPGSDGCTLDIDVHDLRALKITDPADFQLDGSTTVTVEYYAKLNENAVVGNGDPGSDPGNQNKVKLEYSNDPHDDSTHTTEEKEVWVYTFGFKLNKIGTGTDEKGLAGAGFMLKDADQTHYAKFKDVDGKKVLDGWEAKATVDALITAYNDAKKAWDEAQPNAQPTEGTVYTDYQAAVKALEPYILISSSDPDKLGQLPDVVGLDADTYYLEEVITPAGYNTMDDFKVDIEATVSTDKGTLDQFVYTPNDGTPVTYKSGEVYQSGLIPQTLTNTKAPFLPFTGGIGTLVFYVLGIALIAGAITYLVIASKKRNKAEETA